MLPLPRLNDQSFEDIVENAVRLSGAEPRVWDDRDVHDPGVTLLDLFAFLKLTQQEYIDAIGSRSLLKMLELLDIRPEDPACAQTECCFHSDTHTEIARGTRLMGGNIAFETAERVYVAANRLKSLIVLRDGTVLRSYLRVTEEPKRKYVFGDRPMAGDCFLLGFDRPFEAGRAIRFFFEVEGCASRRNPVTETSDFIELATLKWEYYGEKNGETDWHPLAVSDATHGLLFPGSIVMELDGEHRASFVMGKDEYYLRCTLVKNGYDCPPQVMDIRCNHVTAFQKETVCETVEFTRAAWQAGERLFESVLAGEGTHRLFIKKEGFWVEADSSADAYTVEPEANGYYSLRLGEPITDGVGRLEGKEPGAPEEPIESGEPLDPNEPLLRLVFSAKGFDGRRYFNGNNGAASMIFVLPRNLVPGDFALMAGVRAADGQLYYEDWRRVRDFDEAGPDDPCYMLDAETGAIKFGDNEHGRVPMPGAAHFVLNALATTRAAEGNTQAGQIEGFEHAALYPGVEVYQHKAAAGGRAAEAIDQAIRRFRADQNAVTRAVTAEDYETLAINTPGLLLKKTTALPLYKPGLIGYPDETAPNCVTVVFEPEDAPESNDSLRLYAENMRRHLEKHKLITTQIFVTAPHRLGLEIYGEIAIKPEYRDAEAIIRSAVAEFIETDQSRRLNQAIYFGDVYGVIDALECTEAIRYIKLETYGEVVPKNRMGDLILPPTARVYLKDVHLNLVGVANRDRRARR